MIFNTLEFPFYRTFLQASIPLLAYSMISFTETILSWASELLKDQKDPLWSAQDLDDSMIGSIKNSFLGLYSNYPLFIITMLVLNGIINFVRRSTISIESLNTEKDSKKDKRMIPRIIKNCLCFTLIYTCFQLVSLSMNSPLTQQKSYPDDDNIMNGLKEFSRILAEDPTEQTSLMIREASLFKGQEANLESLGIGKIVGSMPIKAASMVISKNGKTVFLIEKQTGKLKILDISEPQNPEVISSFTFNKIPFDTRQVFLSPDEKTLFTSVSFILEIIDVSDLKSPDILASISDAYFFDYTSSMKPFKLFEPSIAMSWDQKTLYVGGNGLQIFSIEDLNLPQLIYSSFRDDISEAPYATSVVTSADKKTLYFANSTIQVYDISLNSSNPRVQSTFKMESRVSSMILGKDNKTLYAVGRAENNTVILEKIAIQKDLKSLESFNLGIISCDFPFLLEKSLSENTFFLFTTEAQPDIDFPRKTLRAYNVLTREILDTSKGLILSSTEVLKAVPGPNNNFITITKDQLEIVSFFSNYPNPYSFGLSNSTIGSYQSEDLLQFVMPGVDRLYTITVSNDSCYYFNILDMSSDKNEPKTIASFLLRITAISFQITENAKRALAFDEVNNIQVLDFSNIDDIKSLGFIHRDHPEREKFFALDDGKTAFTYIMDQQSQVAQLKMIDFSSLFSVKIIAQEEIENAYENIQIQYSNKKRILFVCLQNQVLIYNFSAMDDGGRRRVGKIDFQFTEEDVEYLVGCTLSEEKDAFFLETFDQNYLYSLSIFNVSDLKNIEHLTTYSLPKLPEDSIVRPLRISSDGLRAFFFEPQHILAFDLSKLNSPKLIGQLPVPSTQLRVSKFSLSGDNKAGYLQVGQRILMIDLEMKYSLYLNNKDFSLGEKYAADFMFLQLDEKSHFQPLADYKIIKLSLSKISLDPGKYEAQTSFMSLPDWMTFNIQNSLVHLESKKQRDLGAYTLYSAASLKIPFEAFGFLGNVSVIEDLFGSLISFGFLDSQRFLTGAFNSYENFLIASQYSDYKKKIYDILKQYYFETFTPFDILPSLNLKIGSENHQRISIMTPSLDSIKVDIKLKYNYVENADYNPQFLSRSYGSLVPLITEHKTHLRIEGPLRDVNLALQSLIVNNQMLYCEGEILVTDNLNQPIVKEVKNIMRYFTSNKPPRVNLNIQNQIDLVPVYTGEFLTIPLNESTFIDDNVENLNYKLVMNTPERHEKPGWLVFDNHMVLKGTAPEEFWDRKIKLLLIAENEFEKVEAPFILEIKLSPVYLLKILIRLSPYILTIVGIYIKANKIYNIVFRWWYKHPKEFFVEIGREIGPDVIPPVWFIFREKKESRIIMKEVCMKIAEELKCSVSDKEKIVDYFWNSEELDVEKLKLNIEEVVEKIKDKNKVKLYLSEGKARKALMNKMVENQFVLWKLDSKPEKVTKKIYNKMKKSWVDLVKWNKSSSQFLIRQEKFDEILGGLREKVPVNNESMDLENQKEPLLIQKEESPINVSLLKKALIILAFNNYSVNRKGAGAFVKVKQKEESNCLKRLFRKNLKDVSLSDGGNVGYGIMYSIEGDRMEITGAPNKHFEDETLVIQITNRHQRILKEFWIHGVTTRAGESYEVF